MPGLSQLKQFSKDLLSVGDEVMLRAGRGEKPVVVPIPNGIEDKDDSEDFVIGMPVNENPVSSESAGENLSSEAPDMSSLLSPSMDSVDSNADMPDLSMFDEPVEDAAPVEEAPAKSDDVSVADMGLDALLAGTGFDNTEGLSLGSENDNEEEKSPTADDFSFDDLGVPFEDVNAPAKPAANNKDVVPEDLDFDLNLDGDLGGTSDNSADSVETLDEPIEEPLEEPIEEPVEEPLEDLGASTDDFDLNLDSPAEDLSAPAEEVSEPEDLSASMDLDAPVEDAVETAESLDTPIDDLAASMDLDAPVEDIAEPADDLSAPVEENTASSDNIDFSLDDMEAPVADSGESSENNVENAESFEEPSADEIVDAPAEDLSGAMDDFDLPDFDAPADAAEEAIEEGTESAEPDADAVEDFEAPEMADAADVSEAEEIPEAVEEAETVEDADDANPPQGLFDANDLDMKLDDMPSLDETPADNATAEPEEIPETDEVEEIPEIAETEEIPEIAETEEIPEIDETEEIPEIDETEEIPEIDETEDVESIDEPLEEETTPDIFDTSALDEMDFSIPDTDAQMEEHDFELGNDDEFAMEGDFEIPGFSDSSDSSDAMDRVAKGAPAGGAPDNGGLDTPDFSNAVQGSDNPPNTLTDEQYQEFLKNLRTYPLNVRLAFEDLIVQDEFTEDAEFEVIEKILKRAPARSVASMLEKMLDISLPVPRDYESRTVEEYEAYKKSLSYQLRNKIIPGILIGIVFILVSWGLFNFSKNCIYKPLKAVSLYKQGYALLEADEYPQAEMKYNDALTYRINKKWLFNYARGYRAHKQYQRADKIYQSLLMYFNHDKQAGLEYADMQLNDLANYERAEEIVRREVLDYHINDEEGILKLGDIFLEWGTEKDPSKLDMARDQYLTLLQLYGGNDKYNARMLLYYIRSDNFRQVLQNKSLFEGKGREKSLSASDWTELSGYLLNKAYGPLAPSEEYLRYQIEGLRTMLITAVKADASNPIALYNLARYYIQTGETNYIEQTLSSSIEMFNKAKTIKRRDIYKYIDTYRLLGEYYVGSKDYLQAQEQFAEGISLYTTERDNAGFTGNQNIGKLFEDLGNIKYFISGDYDDALVNYKASVELENDSPAIRYKIGYIQYSNQNYGEALGSFMKAGDANVKGRNLMLAMANTLSLRGDDYAAEGYYNQLIATLDEEVAEKGITMPHKEKSDLDLLTTYLYAANNYGVTLYRLARRTGDSSKNGEAIVQFSQSLRAWDAITRNQTTMVRLGGSNLAEMNIKYMTHPIPDYEPAIYNNISKTIVDNEKF